MLWIRSGSGTACKPAISVPGFACAPVRVGFFDVRRMIVVSCVAQCHLDRLAIDGLPARSRKTRRGFVRIPGVFFLDRREEGFGAAEVVVQGAPCVRSG